MKFAPNMLSVACVSLAACATTYSTPAYYRTAAVATSAKAPFGTYLVDNRGLSLYILEGTRGMTGMNRCAGECLRVWPPAMAARPTMPGPGIDPARLTTVAGPWGAQLAYGGWPLYYYHRDRAPGDTTGQHVMDRWGTWHLVAPSGEPIRPAGQY